MNALIGSELNLVRLEDALLCANCESIANETLTGNCPACGSRALLNVSRLLGGTLERPCKDSFVGQLAGSNPRAESLVF